METLYKITFLENDQAAFVVADSLEKALRIIEAHLKDLNSDETVTRVVRHGPILFLQTNPY